MRTQLNGITLAYDDAGKGPAILFIHGFPLSRKIWEPQMEALESGFRTIAPDLRGFGESDAPDGPYTMDIFADDMIALLDRLGIERAVVCGMSMGGYVLLNMLKRYPERVRAACFMVTKSGSDDEAGKERRRILAEEVLASGAKTVADAFGKILFASGAAEEKTPLAAEIGRIMLATEPKGLAGGLLAMRERPDSTGLLAGFNFPSLVIGAEQDMAIPPGESQRLADGLPDARLVMIPGAGHMAGMENPAAVNGALLEFLSSLP